MSKRTFLFDSDKLYLHDRTTFGPEEVERLTLECYDVQFKGRNFVGGHSYQFKIKGRGDTVYETQYDWALVLNTPENLEAIKRRNELRSIADEAEKAAHKAGAQVQKVSHIPVKELHR